MITFRSLLQYCWMYSTEAICFVRLHTKQRIDSFTLHLENSISSFHEHYDVEVETYCSSYTAMLNTGCCVETSDHGMSGPFTTFFNLVKRIKKLFLKYRLFWSLKRNRYKIHSCYWYFIRLLSSYLYGSRICLYIYIINNLFSLNSYERICTCLKRGFRKHYNISPL